MKREAVGLLLFGAAVFVAAAIGALSSMNAADTYAELDTPSWAPPTWLFGPAWTTLYILIAVSGWLVWRELDSLKNLEMGLYGSQLFLNALWTPLFFAWELRGFALAWILLLDLVVIATIVVFWKRNRLAAYLLVPYLAWICFATALNASIWSLN